MTALAQSLSTLPIEEKLQLVWDLWDSITDQSKIPVKAEDIQEMERRLDEYESDGDKGETWEVVRERIRARL